MYNLEHAMPMSKNTQKLVSTSMTPDSEAISCWLHPSVWPPRKIRKSFCTSMLPPFSLLHGHRKAKHLLFLDIFMGCSCVCLLCVQMLDPTQHFRRCPCPIDCQFLGIHVLPSHPHWGNYKEQAQNEDTKVSPPDEESWSFPHFYSPQQVAWGRCLA